MPLALRRRSSTQAAALAPLPFAPPPPRPSREQEVGNDIYVVMDGTVGLFAPEDPAEEPAFAEFLQGSAGQLRPSPRHGLEHAGALKRSQRALAAAKATAGVPSAYALYQVAEGLGTAPRGVRVYGV